MLKWEGLFTLHHLILHLQKPLLYNSSTIQHYRMVGPFTCMSGHTNLILTNETKINLSDNFANDDGETIYVQMKDSLVNFNTSEIHFSNTNVQATNRSVYINVLNSCNKSCLSQKFIRFQGHKRRLPVATSPWKLILYDPTKCITETYSDCNVYHISNIMLGQEIRFNACVLDYYDQPTELTQFFVTGMDHQHYNMSGSKLYFSIMQL